MSEWLLWGLYGCSYFFSVSVVAINEGNADSLVISKGPVVLLLILLDGATYEPVDNTDEVTVVAGAR